MKKLNFENIVISFIKDIFEEERVKAVSFLRKRKNSVVFFGGLILFLFLDFRFNTFRATVFLVDYFFTTLKQIPQGLINLIFIIWLIIISVFVFKSRRQILMSKGDFFDDFKKGLRSSEWEWYGGWNIEEEAGKNVLSVTNSGDGGFTRVGTHWTNYIFTFDTKIISSCSGWLIRVKDKHNYLMLQCRTDSVVPDIRINSFWEVGNPIPLNNPLQTNIWYNVEIKVRGNIVEIKINNNNIRYTIPSIMTPKNPPVYSGADQKATFNTDLISGRTGFREYGSEKALFRNVRITTIR